MTLEAYTMCIEHLHLLPANFEIRWGLTQQLEVYSKVICPKNINYFFHTISQTNDLIHEIEVSLLKSDNEFRYPDFDIFEALIDPCIKYREFMQKTHKNFLIDLVINHKDISSGINVLADMY